MNRLNPKFFMRDDYIISHLRAQIRQLQILLDVMESDPSKEDRYVLSSIKAVEEELRRIRNLIDN